MPNWCNNRVTVNGDITIVKRFQEFVKSDKEPFSFESILPMPKELHNVQSPTSIKTQEEIDAYVKEYTDKNWAMVETLPITQEQIPESVSL